MREILARVARTYAFCASYQDIGEVTTNGDTELTFSTAFIRPDRLFFEYTRGSGDHLALWKNEKGVYSRWTMQPIVQKGPLEMVIAGATGVSRSTACTIPGMLIPEQTGGWGGFHGDFATLRVTGIKISDGVPCYEIIPTEATPPVISVLAIYVDARSFLLRKLVERYSGTNDEETKLYHPHVDIPISQSRFHFTPPK